MRGGVPRAIFVGSVPPEISPRKQRGRPGGGVEDPWGLDSALVGGGHVAQDASGALHAGAGAAQPAELPQLARGAVVLTDDLVDSEGVELTGAEAIDGLSDALEELAEPRLVVAGDQRSIGLALTLRTHAGRRAFPAGRKLAHARARDPDVHSNAERIFLWVRSG